MRIAIREFVHLAAQHLPLQEPIVEFGSFIVPEQQVLANLRPLFPKQNFFGCDMRLGNGVQLQSNLHHPGIKPHSIGTILCLDTLEHVEYPHQALENIHRLLKPEGIAIVSSVMKFPIHEYPSDYWRFTPFGFKSLLKPFKNSLVETAGGEESLPETIVGVGFSGAMPPLAEFSSSLRKWKARQNSALKRIARTILPPILFHWLGRLIKRG